MQHSSVHKQDLIHLHSYWGSLGVVDMHISLSVSANYCSFTVSA